MPRTHPWPGERCRVLVVDDNRDAANTLVLLLHFWGVEAKAAYDAGGALAVARQLRPDLAFLDIGLPDATGVDLARALVTERLCPWSSLVAVTGHTNTAAQCREAGFAACLFKPVEPDTLRDIIYTAGHNYFPEHGLAVCATA